MEAQLREKLLEVQERIGNGTAWLAANGGEKGQFHFWYISGILPSSPMPAQSSHVRESYAKYHRARRLLDALDTQESKLERQLAAVTK